MAAIPTSVDAIVDCPLCPGALSIQLDVRLEVTVGRLRPTDGMVVRQSASVYVISEVSDEGRALIAEHIRVAHPDIEATVSDADIEACDAQS